jgi:sugar O-acyltransferase (sialic acid O-acetyltransferase NeuD family)
MKNPVLIFGSGVLGKIALNIFESNEVFIYGFLDDDKKKHGSEISNVTILGPTDEQGFLKLIGQKTEAFIAIGNAVERKTLVEILNTERKVMPVNAVHARAYVAEESTLGHGNLIAANATVNPFAEVGSHTIIHSGAVIDTDAKVGDFVQIGTGAMINSGVTIEEGAFIGSGAIIVGGITVGKNARIGAGSVVVKDVAKNTTVFGNPAVKV